MNPYKVGWFYFYAVMGLGGAVRRAGRRSRDWWRKITGKWYCAGCGRYHNRRVVAYFIDDICDGCCYKHITPEEAQKMEVILLGRQQVTRRVKALCREMERAGTWAGDSEREE